MAAHLIDDEEKARRLARAICADVMLYNAAVKDAPVHERAGLIEGPVTEGRGLYSSRVSPRLVGIFEQEVAALIAGPLGVQLSAPSAAPTQQSTPLAAPVVVEAGGGGKLVIVAAIVIAVAAAAFFLLRP